MGCATTVKNQYVRIPVDSKYRNSCQELLSTLPKGIDFDDVLEARKKDVKALLTCEDYKDGLLKLIDEHNKKGD